MRDTTKYQGIIPAFYACYDEEGNISTKGVEDLTHYLVKKGVKGVYVGGSSGECIYQSVEERKIVLEHVVKAAEGKLTIIAHVACNNTKDSKVLAAHAESLGVDAIAAIPPIYFQAFYGITALSTQLLQAEEYYKLQNLYLVLLMKKEISALKA